MCKKGYKQTLETRDWIEKFEQLWGSYPKTKEENAQGLDALIKSFIRQLLISEQKCCIHCISKTSVKELIDKTKQETKEEIREELKHIAQYHERQEEKAPFYRVKDVLDILDRLKT